MRRTRLAPTTWRLEDVLPEMDGRAQARFLKDLEGRTRSFEALRGRLHSFGAPEVEGALRSYESIVSDIARINSQAFMKFSADTGDQRAKAYLDKAEELEAEFGNRMLFFRLWWTFLSAASAKHLAPREPDYRYILESWGKLRPHTLDEKVEQAVNLKNTTGSSGWSHLYDQLTSGFSFTLKVRGKTLRGPDGKPKVMVVEQISRLFGSSDSKTREAAYRTLLAKYAENGSVLGEIYRTIVRDWRNENMKLRGYSSPIAPRNLENDVPDGAVDVLLKVCSSEAPVFQDFFRIKGRLLGFRKMSRYHLYAPLETKEKSISYEEAVRNVLEAFGEFDQRVAKMALRVFQSRHVDSSPRKGKRAGAYCMSVVPSVVPYLFLNFAGMTRDVYTIAHESGHAVHSQLSSDHSVLTFHPPLVLAETASVFGEMILFDNMMKNEKDPEVRRSVLLDRLSSVYATIGRQSHFVLFEKEAHEAVATGATVEDLCKAYIENLRGQFGSSVSVPDEFRWEWTYIPHIYHTPFYCYAYAFGNLLSLALYDRYVREGKDFVPDYLRILSFGGSESPSKILQDVGIDLRSERFWQSGFDVIKRMVDQLQIST